MNTFSMNGYLWKVSFVNPIDQMLVDRTQTLRLATTDPKTMTIYLSNTLSSDMLSRVLIHELGHCAIYSFGLLQEIHKMVLPQHWIEAEEWVCNFIADYGYRIFSAASGVLGDLAWIYIPSEIEKLIA